MKKEKGVSAVDFFCIGFGAIVGVGWAVSINSWMNSSGGPLPAAAGYMVAMILMVPIALCYCELCTMLPVSGGGMAYAFRHLVTGLRLYQDGRHLERLSRSFRGKLSMW